MVQQYRQIDFKNLGESQPIEVPYCGETISHYPDFSRLHPESVLKLANDQFLRTTLIKDLSGNGFSCLQLPKNLGESTIYLLTKALFGNLINNQVYDGEGSERHVCHTDWNGLNVPVLRGNYPVVKPTNFTTNLYYKTVPSSGGILQIHHTSIVLREIERMFPNSYRHFFDRDCVRNSRGSISPLLQLVDFGKITLQFYEGDIVKPEAAEAYDYLIKSLKDPKDFSLVRPQSGSWIVMVGGIIHSRSSHSKEETRKIYLTTHHNPPPEFKISIV